MTSISSAQKTKDYMLVRHDTTGNNKYAFFFINQKGDTLTKLDSSKYFLCLGDTIQHFAIVGIRNKKGWWAIDKNENLLFQIFNTSSGEPSPDELREGMIRIIDENEKIGFGNYKGQIEIKPQFEAATSFYNGKSIIGKHCQEILWCCEGENSDKHYITDCTQTGYINKKGKIFKIGNYSFEQIQNEIGWKSEIDDWVD